MGELTLGICPQISAGIREGGMAVFSGISLKRLKI